MTVRLNRINDYFFKYLFGRPERKDLLLSLLNSILSPDGENELTDITLADRELDPEHLKDKMSRLDLSGITNDGSVINIEVQINNEHDIDKRTMYYWAKVYQSRLKSGMIYRDLARTVTINVLDFSYLPDPERYHSMYSLYEAHSGERLNRDLEIHFIELAKWKKLKPKAKNLLEKWLVYFSNDNPEELEEIAMSEPAISKALTAEEIFLQNDKERYLYEMREKALTDHLSAIYYAKVEGEAKGRAEGLVEGENKAKTEIVLSMHEKGIPFQTIADITKLSVVKVEEIIQHHQN